MNALQTEWARLYAANAGHSADSLVAPDGRVRALVLGLSRPADWHALSVLWRGVQSGLRLPAPAIAVTGVDGLDLWFSLAEPIAATEAQAFLQSLCQRFLPDVAPARLHLLPGLHDSVLHHAMPVPARQAHAERWSAFVAPDLAAIFAEEPWLEACPSPEAQASVLARIRSITPAAFATAWQDLQGDRPSLAPAASANTAAVAVDPLPASPASPAKSDLDPRRFLQDVLNNPAHDMALRIAAASALLPKA